MLALAGVLIAWSVHDHRAAVERGAVETARALRTAVDRELDSTITSLQAVAAGTVFGHGDAAEIHVELARLLPTQPDWVNIVVVVPEGREVVNLYRNPGEPLPPIQDRLSFDD